MGRDVISLPVRTAPGFFQQQVHCIARLALWSVINAQQCVSARCASRDRESRPTPSLVRHALLKGLAKRRGCIEPTMDTPGPGSEQEEFDLDIDLRLQGERNAMPKTNLPASMAAIAEPCKSLGDRRIRRRYAHWRCVRPRVFTSPEDASVSCRPW